MSDFEAVNVFGSGKGQKIMLNAKEIGERIRDLRINMRTKDGKRVSQERMAEEVGMNIKTIQAYENGKKKPSLDALDALIEYFGVSPDYILYGKVESLCPGERSLIKSLAMGILCAVQN